MKTIINPDYVGNNDKTIEQRFWEKVSIDSINECWEWKAGKYPKGYGSFRLPNGSESGSRISAHRYSYFLSTGYFPKTKEYVCHKCDNPSCVNPNHLFLGTQFDNMKDMVNKGRNSDVSGKKNPNSKLTELDVYEIRRLSDLGISGRYLCKMFRISQTQMSRIIHRESWAWL